MPNFAVHESFAEGALCLSLLQPMQEIAGMQVPNATRCFWSFRAARAASRGRSVHFSRQPETTWLSMR